MSCTIEDLRFIERGDDSFEAYEVVDGGWRGRQVAPWEERIPAYGGWMERTFYPESYLCVRCEREFMYWSTAAEHVGQHDGGAISDAVWTSI